MLLVYFNLIFFVWCLDILKEFGYDVLLKIYSEVFEVGKKLKVKYLDKVFWVKGDLFDLIVWMCWFDFFLFYDVVFKGNVFVEDGKLVVDDKVGIELLIFMFEL